LRRRRAARAASWQDRHAPAAPIGWARPHQGQVLDDAWQQAALERGVNPHAAEHLTKLWGIFRAEGAQNYIEARSETDDIIEKLLGRAPRTLAQFLQSQPDRPA
jgi:hypothetical protein